MGRLYPYVRPYRGEFALGLVMLLLSSGTNLAFPGLLGGLVDATEKAPNTLNLLALQLAGILVLQAVFSFFRIVLFERVAERALASLRQAMYRHLIVLPLPYFHEKRVGELTNRLQSDIGVLQETFTTTLAEFIRQVVVIGGGLALLTYTSPQLTVFMLAVLPVVVVLAVVFGSRIRKYSKKVQDASAESNAVVEEALQGIATVKAFSGESFEWSRYETRTNTVAQLAIKSGILRGAFASFLILGLFGALVAVVWKGTTLIATGELATGQLVSFVIYSGFIGGSIGGMADVYARLQKAVGATEALLDMLDTPTEPLDARPPHAQKNAQPEALPEPLPNTPHLAFTDVSFSYPARPDLPVLQHLTLSVPRGGQIALVGASGAGKSTLIQLILRFHQPQSGSIQWFGHPLENLPLAELRRTMALVPQEVVLFSGTLRENIAYGLTGTTDEALLEVAAQANALEFIQSFPQGLDTLVGERGVQLSGGQRQRIAIARALLRNPSLLLLDEATSALDSESESLVQDALQRLMAGRTSVVVAHRLSTVRHADAIAVFHKGQVVELGTHEELLALPNGRYRKLLDKQLHG